MRCFYQLKYFFEARVLEETGKFSNKFEMSSDATLNAISTEFTPEQLTEILKKIEFLISQLEEKQFCEILSILENPEFFQKK